MDRPLKPDPDARCDRCGGFGSCCLEFGADDLWRREESPSL
jgi:hypothetical protein